MLKNIVILGAGFAGLKAAKTLAKKIKQPGYQIILIDQNPNHLYRADLYEVATAFNQKITQECLSQLSKTISTPVVDLIDHQKILFIKNRITDISAKEKYIHLETQPPITFEFLIVALGSTTNFFNIPGLETHSFPLKTIQDGIKINCHLDMIFQKNWKNGNKNEICINIGGGGASGVETAAELSGSIKKLCHKYSLPCEKVKINLIEGGNKLGGFNEIGTEIIQQRLQSQKVKIYLNHLIIKAEASKIEINSKKTETTSEKTTLPSDILIWTGGVEVSPLVQKTLGNKELRGAIPINQFLQTSNNSHIYAAGDNAFFPDQQNPQNRLPMLATIADEQGKHIANNIINQIEKKPLAIYKHKPQAYMLPLGGKFALYQKSNHLLKGRIIWLIRRLHTLKYLLSIMTITQAIKTWLHGNKIFIQND